MESLVIAMQRKMIEYEYERRQRESERERVRETEIDESVYCMNKSIQRKDFQQ